jgi:uncharacterized protein (DUF305 family)
MEVGMSTKLVGGAFALVVVLIIAGASVLSGAEDDGSASEETDGAFVSEMVPHHESAIDMAEIALKEAEHPEIKELANSIIASQSEEISTLESIHQRLFEAPIGEVDHGTLGLAEHEMGMDADVATLSSAKPFDRAFIDMMILHHQGAIGMARIEIAHGGDEETQALAERMIAAQSREIEDMNSWRSEWYGEASPAGGVPPADTAPTHEAMGH